jgi:hypothetical protein
MVCNRAKREMSYEDFCQWIERLSDIRWAHIEGKVA